MLIDTTGSPYLTKLKSDVISASVFSTTQNMTIFGGSYHLNVYPPLRGGSPNPADTHTAWDGGAGITNNAVKQTVGNLQGAPLPTQQLALIVSDDLLGKQFPCLTILTNKLLL